MIRFRQHHADRRFSFRALRRLIADNRGATALLTGIGFTALVGFAGLGTEVASWYVEKRSMQGAADAAAYGAAVAAMHAACCNSLPDATTEAQAVSGSYGFVNGKNGVTVVVSNPPANPINPSLAGNTDAYQAVVTAPQTRLFSKLLVSTSMSISAQAVALIGTPPDGCVMALNPGTVTGIRVNGGVQVDLNGCSIVSNAKGSSSLVMNGASGTINALAVSLGGSYTGGGTINATHGVKTNQPPVPDPLANRTIPWPSPVPPSPPCDRNGSSISGGTTLNSPYGLSKGYVICGDIRVNNGILTFNSGIYILDQGSLTVGGGATITATAGVTIIFASSTGTNYGSLKIAGNPTINITAPNSGPTKGIAIWEDKTAPEASISINGASSMNIQGVVYMPSQDVTYAGNPSSACTQLIANIITLSGASGFSNSCPSSPGLLSPFGGTPPLLVE